MRDRDLLDDPEARWQRSRSASSFSRAEVEARIGPIGDDGVAVLSGGLSNLNLRVGGDRVLRIHRRNPSVASQTIAKEAALMSRTWRSFRAPKVLATGADFLVLEYLELERLRADEPTAFSLGAALAEIHATETDSSLDEMLLHAQHDFSAASYGRAQLSSATSHLGPDRTARVSALLDEAAAQTDELGAAVLSHGDFKPSNLRRATDGTLVVLDWEFAWRGPRLFDMGQLCWWNQAKHFTHALEHAYREHGGLLDGDWRSQAEALDLGNLLGLLANAELSNHEHDLLARVDATLRLTRA